MSEPRRLYTHAELRRVLNPGSVAIVGATPRAGAFGERVLFNLGGYDGNIFLVNGRYDRIGERPCYKSLAALPESPDCVVVTVAREAVEGVVEDCVSVGAGGAIVFASGYAETALPERIAAQRRLADIAERSGMPIIGPNCIGVSIFGSGARITFMPSGAVAPPSRGAIGIASQSGALGYALSQAAERGVPVSHVLTCGNSCDVDVADAVAYLADDPACAAIALLFEGMRHPRRLIAAAARAWASGKPVVACKLAVGAQGAEAALSHTGSLAGTDAAYRAAFRRAGVVLVGDFEALIETASFLAKAPPPRARGVAVVATSGGAAIMAADKAEAHGVALPQPEAAARAVLETRIPEFGSARNPIDVTAQVLNDPESLPDCMSAILADPGFGALVVPVVYTGPASAARVPLYGRLARESGKPVCSVWLAEWMEGPGARETESDFFTPMFRSMDRCFAAIAAWHRRSDHAAAGLSAPDPTPKHLRAEISALLAAAPDPVLTERDAKRIFARYGVPVIEEILACDEDEAVAGADRLGCPVALKVESPDLPHKTEAGVIRLNVRGAADVRKSFQAVMENAARATARERINGVIVQPMAPPGVEVMVGARVDPLFGPVVIVALGGVLVELLRDNVVELAPLSHADALKMIFRLKGFPALRGFRGSEAVDLDALAAVITKIGAFISDHADCVAELDVNPLICAGNRILAVDALIALAK